MFDSADLLEGLNEEQRQAAAHPEGPLLVLAGAGTGKTRTLVARAAWLCGQGVQPSRILLLTFTRRAAEDMMSRAAARAGRHGGRVTGGTFHSIAHRVIRGHAEAFSLPPEFTVIDPADVTDLLDARRADHGLTGTVRRAPRAAACAEVYTRCVNTQQTVAEVVRGSFPWCVDYTAQLAELFRSFVAHKRSHGLVDFDDLLLLWRAALADPGAGPVLRGMFDAVLVDEYQDVNAVQADIVRLLAPQAGCLTCVGDDAQAIYAFRGADPGHLHRLADTFPGLTVVRLVRNYRSKEAVLRLANVVRPQTPGLGLALTSARESGAAPLLVRCHDEATQAREICTRVLDAHEAGLDLRDQAVLVRTSHHSDVLEIELAARRIPFVKFGGLRFTEAAHVKDFLAAARVVANPADDLGWFRVLRLHEGIGAAHARRVMEVLRPAEPFPFDRWKDAVEAAPRRAREDLAATIGGLAEAALMERTGDRAAAVLAALVGPLRAHYPDAGMRIADLERLAEAAASRPSLHDALVELALDPPSSASDFAGPPRQDEDYLVISTIHSAKGLEWPVVHLPQLVDGAVPSDMALDSATGEAEERRLFYVAVTRARDQLFLYAPLRLHHYRMASDDRHSYGQLSRFLDSQALAVCESVQVDPPPPLLPRTGQLAARVEADLDALWVG
ncbi:MAG TPA: ATP-dependent helicase [Streptosporangiaceae bacterium]|nr:ATP-dependent helicase [Streptosporangiaceae bacterium]